MLEGTEPVSDEPEGFELSQVLRRCHGRNRDNRDVANKQGMEVGMIRMSKECRRKEQTVKKK